MSEEKLLYRDGIVYALLFLIFYFNKSYLLALCSFIASILIVIVVNANFDRKLRAASIINILFAVPLLIEELMNRRYFTSGIIIISLFALHVLGIKNITNSTKN